MKKHISAFLIIAGLSISAAFAEENPTTTKPKDPAQADTSCSGCDHCGDPNKNPQMKSLYVVLW